MSKRAVVVYLVAYLLVGMIGVHSPRDWQATPSSASLDTLLIMGFLVLLSAVYGMFLKVQAKEEMFIAKKQRLLKNTLKLEKWSEALERTRCEFDTTIANLEKSLLERREEAYHALEAEISDKREELSSLGDMKAQLDEMADDLEKRDGAVSLREEHVAREAMRMEKIQDAARLQAL